MKTIYEDFGVTPIINACGTKTALGGALMAPEVVAAMERAAVASVDLAELQAAASKVIAEVTGAEAGYVSAGAAAGLTLAAAACMTGCDPALIDRLPDTTGMKHEIIMLRTQRNSYDHALRASGARIVDVGVNDRGVGAGLRGIEAWEVSAAVTERTAALAFVGGHESDMTLREAVRVAHGHGLPVIVDAAAQLPPRANLRTFIEAGADLVVYSGGKAIGGPQATGVVCGRKALIQAIALNHLDWDIDLPLWRAPEELIPAGTKALPRHGLGRGFKVSKENLVGLLAALTRFSAADVAAEAQGKRALLEPVVQEAERLGRITMHAPEDGYPSLRLQMDEPERARSLYLHLYYGEIRVAVNGTYIADGRLIFNTACLQAGDGERIASALRAFPG